MKLESKFKPGDKVFSLSINEDNSIGEISIDIIESVQFYNDDTIRYWIPSCDWAVEENKIVGYNSEEIFDYLENNLKVNKEVEYK